jgi:uncharacterized protein with NAD-binding domain and iron-sulfur cluster
VSDPRIKVAVLGGGVGSIVTAFYLTSTPALRARYDVTVYQVGWRIGGKGASGRNRNEAVWLQSPLTRELDEAAKDAFEALPDWLENALADAWQKG